MSRSYDRDPYTILGISSAATASQIKEAYHKLARQYHPDLNKDPRAAERMKEINWAYDILSDPQERSLYDYVRNSSVRTEYYYPGSSTPHSTDTSSTGSQRSTQPSSKAYAGRSYINVRMVQNSPTVGCSALGIIWVIVIVIANVVRAIGPSLSPRPSYNFSGEYRATQTAQMATWESSMLTFNAVSSTPSPLPEFFSTPLPRPTIAVPKGNASQAETQSEYAPGSFVWKQLNTYFPELTTPAGLSDEVTSITYDQLKGYHIKTRSLGEYWLYVDRINHVISPMHFPPAADPLSTP